MSQPSGPPDDTGGPPRGEPLFRVMYDAMAQRAGEPTTHGTGALRIEMSPTQMIRLQQALSGSAIHALMLVIQHGWNRNGRRIEIHGWGSPWLREHGMRKYAAETAAKELREKGYIRTDRSSPNTPLGRQVGIVPSGFIEEVEDEPGVPRRPGGQRPHRDLRAVKDTTVGPRSRVPGTTDKQQPEPVEEPVDGSRSRIPRTGPSRDPGNRDDRNSFSQVSAPFPVSENALSTAPTSSELSEEDLFFCPGAGQALARLDLARYFFQPALAQALNGQWEVAVALLAREFVPHATRCAELVEWLGESEDAQPETRLAQMVVDLIRVPETERVAAARSVETFLRSRSVKFRAMPPAEFIAAYVITMVSALDSSRPIESWGGWFGGGLKRESHFQGKVLAATMAVLNRLLEHPEGVPAAELVAQPLRGDTTSKATTFDQDDPTYVDRLRAAAEGTNWEDEVSFEMLLRNHREQARILALYARRTGSAP